jgi:hypothetical protein
MLALHALGTTVTRGGTTADTIKAALYTTAGSIGAGTTAYSATNEVSGTGYTAGGVTVTNATAPTTSGTTGYWTPSAAVVYSTVTISGFDCVLFYNSTQSNRAICSNTFGTQTVTAGNFTINMPTNGAGTALINLA